MLTNFHSLELEGKTSFIFLISYIALYFIIRYLLGKQISGFYHEYRESLGAWQIRQGN